MVVVGLRLLGATLDMLPQANQFFEVDLSCDVMYSWWEFCCEGFLVADGVEVACHGAGVAYLLFLRCSRFGVEVPCGLLDLLLRYCLQSVAVCSCCYLALQNTAQTYAMR